MCWLPAAPLGVRLYGPSPSEQHSCLWYLLMPPRRRPEMPSMSVGAALEHLLRSAAWSARARRRPGNYENTPAKYLRRWLVPPRLAVNGTVRESPGRTTLLGATVASAKGATDACPCYRLRRSGTCSGAAGSASLTLLRQGSGPLAFDRLRGCESHQRYREIR